MSINRNKNQAKRTDQYILNASYDEDFDLLATELLGYDGTNVQRVKTDTSGNLVSVAGFAIPVYDYCSQSQASTADTWTFKTGGAGGTTVATITIQYTTSDKSVIQSVTKT